MNTSGPINIVPATTQTMQVQGQKVAVASVSAASQPTQSIVTSVATVQVAQGQVRPQFIKQVGTKVGRADNEMFLVKRQVLTPNQHKQQIIPQSTQIFTPTNIQVQQTSQSQNTQVSSSGNTQVNLGQQQQIATIVKTSGNPSSITTSGNMLSQIKQSGQIKVMGNQTQMRSLQLQQQPIYQRKVGMYIFFT